MLDWDVATQDEFDRLPSGKKPKPADPAWEGVLNELQAGNPVRLRYADEKQMRGLRLSLGRRAKRQGMTVELRYGDGYLIARKVGEPGEPVATGQAPAQEKPAIVGRRRRRKAEADEPLAEASPA